MVKRNAAQFVRCRVGAFGSDVQEIFMVNGSTDVEEAVPSAVSSDGTSFTVSWASE